jgi:potassium-transporting ATPase KdpC subunit
MDKTDSIILQFRRAMIVFAIMTILLGILYPLIVTGIAQMVFPYQANGSMVIRDQIETGSSLVGQANSDERYFWPRPSAISYDPLPSGASNEGPTSSALAELVRQRESEFRTAHQLDLSTPVPVEMLFASGSGLDPHISPQAARLQVERVSQTRGIAADRVADLVEAHIEGSQWGFLGQPRVNVFMLNLALDELE